VGGRGQDGIGMNSFECLQQILCLQIINVYFFDAAALCRVCERVNRYLIDNQRRFSFRKVKDISRSEQSLVLQPLSKTLNKFPLSEFMKQFLHLSQLVGLANF
jgi:hypothetical protein